MCEIGGTVGDIEALPFFEAIRQLGYEMPNQCAFLHLTLLPYIESADELKTKPTQHSVKELRSIGIQPSIILCRVERPIETINKSLLEKIAQMSEGASQKAQETFKNVENLNTQANAQIKILEQYKF